MPATNGGSGGISMMLNTPPSMNFGGSYAGGFDYTDHGSPDMMMNINSSGGDDVFYGMPPSESDGPVLPLQRTCRRKASPYANEDVQRADSEWSIILPRYFNPVGAHLSGIIGEDPRGTPNNLMPCVQQVAVGRCNELTVFRNDYQTPDGTGVRDYIHVMDLSDGHIAALQKLFETKDLGCEVYNLGTGKGSFVLEMVAAFKKASGKKIPLKIAARRPGDSEIVYSSIEKAERELHWKAKYGIEEMCHDQWNWASKNPWGYGSPETTD